MSRSRSAGMVRPHGRRRGRRTAFPRSLGGGRIGAPTVILALLLGAVTLGGGASFSTALGQMLVRAAAIGAVIALLLSGARVSDRRLAWPLGIVAAAMIVALVQIIPLPPSWWAALPGRAPLAAVVETAGAGGVWRPMSIVPSLTLNALFALLVPAAVLLAMAAAPASRGRGALILLLAMVGLSAFCGLIQLSGAALDNPFLNDRLGQPGGLFANRNHQALFLAMGVPVACAWGCAPSDRRAWRVWAAAGIVALLSLTVIGTGSRAGIGLLAVAIVGGGLIAWPRVRRLHRAAPRWLLPVAIGAAALLLVGLIGLSVNFGRAEAVDRLFAEEVGADMRTRALPTLWSMTATYLPWGSGLGSFDAAFRIAEPFALLKRTYFNHAHDDYLEVLITAGIPGALLLLAALGWFAAATWRAWRGDEERMHVARTGSVVLMLALLASVADYPARTPLIMTAIAMAAAWLCPPARTRATGDDAG